jgi:hypothetical protein
VEDVFFGERDRIPGQTVLRDMIEQHRIKADDVAELIARIVFKVIFPGASPAPDPAVR